MKKYMVNVFIVIILVVPSRDEKLTNYQVLSIFATKKEIEKDIKKNKLIKYKSSDISADTLESNYLSIILILLKKINDGTIHHLLTYHNTIINANKFSKLLKDVQKVLYKTNIFISSMSGRESIKVRDKTLKEFYNHKQGIICSSRVLNEGIDIPIVDAVCFVDARQSTIDIIQCIGRSLRLYKDKKMASIIVPIFIDNFDDDFERNVFCNIITIAKALKNSDDRIVEEFLFKTKGIQPFKTHSIFNTENYVNSSKKIDLHEWHQNINTQIWEIVDSWQSKYDLVNVFVEINEKLPNKRSLDENEKQIGFWCNTQRKTKKNGKMSQEKILLLEKISIWYWSDETKIIIKSLEERAEEYKKWVKDNDKLPCYYKFPENNNEKCETSLAEWATRVKKSKKDDLLSLDHIALMEKIPNWSWVSENRLVKRAEEYNQWIKQNNRLPSFSAKDDYERGLNTWAAKRRIDKKNNMLSNEHILLLEKLPKWHWIDENIKIIIKTFEQRVEDYKKMYTDKNGPPMKSSLDPEERLLYRWAFSQRASKRNNTLADYRIKILEEIPYWKWA